MEQQEINLKDQFKIRLKALAQKAINSNDRMALNEVMWLGLHISPSFDPQKILDGNYDGNVDKARASDLQLCYPLLLNEDERTALQMNANQMQRFTQTQSAPVTVEPAITEEPKLNGAIPYEVMNEIVVNLDLFDSDIRKQIRKTLQACVGKTAEEQTKEISDLKDTEIGRKTVREIAPFLLTNDYSGAEAMLSNLIKSFSQDPLVSTPTVPVTEISSSTAEVPKAAATEVKTIEQVIEDMKGKKMNEQIKILSRAQIDKKQHAEVLVKANLKEGNVMSRSAYDACPKDIRRAIAEFMRSNPEFTVSKRGLIKRAFAHEAAVDKVIENRKRAPLSRPDSRENPPSTAIKSERETPA